MPGASDRGGTSDDGDNFVLLVEEMRASFGTKYGISVTLPTSYWYLQGFKVTLTAHLRGKPHMADLREACGDGEICRLV